MSTVVAYLAYWVVLALLAVGNGILREATFGRHLSELRAHQLSTLTGMALCGIAVGLFSHWQPIATAHEAIIIGAAWLAMTVAFELTFGRLVAHHSWSRLIQDYDLRSGRLWPLFLAWIGLLPWLANLDGA